MDLDNPIQIKKKNWKQIY